MTGTGEDARMHLETRIIRSNGAVFQSRCPPEGGGRPGGYT